jgi:hypothetical protein
MAIKIGIVLCGVGGGSVFIGGSVIFNIWIWN